MTKSQLIAIVNNELPAGMLAVKVYYTRFSGDQYGNGAYRMGVLLSNQIHVLAWFKLFEIDQAKHKILVDMRMDKTSDWELKLITKK